MRIMKDLSISAEKKLTERDKQLLWNVSHIVQMFDAQLYTHNCSVWWYVFTFGFAEIFGAIKLCQIK